MHDFIDGIRPLDDVLYDIQEYCEKGTSLKKIKDTITVLQGEIPEIRLKNIVLLKKTVQNLFAQQHQRNHLVEL